MYQNPTSNFVGREEVIADLNARQGGAKSNRHSGARAEGQNNSGTEVPGTRVSFYIWSLNR